MDGSAVEKEIAAVRHMVRTRLGIGGRFARQMRRARRHLPKSLHGDVEVLEQAAIYGANPKMARLVDPLRVAEARRVIVGHLQDKDRRAGKADWWNDIFTTVGFNTAVIVAVAGLVIWWM